MTRVCLLGTEDVALRQTLLSHQTARNALQTYDIEEPFHNAIAVETVSLGAAVSLLNDLQWYLVRYVRAAMVREPSISETEWLSRDLAVAIRDDEVEPADSGRFLLVYGVVPPEADSPDEADSPSERSAPRLVEPMYVTRTDRTIPEYDLRDVSETLRVRVTGAEFSQ